MTYRLINIIINGLNKIGRAIIIKGTAYRVADGEIPIGADIADYLQQFWDRGHDINYDAARREIIMAHWPQHKQNEAIIEFLWGSPAKLAQMKTFIDQLKQDVPKP